MFDEGWSLEASYPWFGAGGPGQVKEVTDQEGFISDCVGAAGDEDLDLAGVPPKQLCFLAFLPNILDTKVRYCFDQVGHNCSVCEEWTHRDKVLHVQKCAHLHCRVGA